MSTLPSTSEATGPERLEAIKDVTLDEVLRRNPKAQPHTDEELISLVSVLRRERADIAVKKEKKRERRKENATSN